MKLNDNSGPVFYIGPDEKPVPMVLRVGDVVVCKKNDEQILIKITKIDGDILCGVTEESHYREVVNLKMTNIFGVQKINN